MLGLSPDQAFNLLLQIPAVFVLLLVWYRMESRNASTQRFLENEFSECIDTLRDCMGLPRDG